MQTNIDQSQTVLSQRRGKIARLPRDVRDQLNARLNDGQEAGDLLPWLNGLPEVQQIIAKRFDGIPISPQNLSAWRQGGFQEWLIHRQLLDSAAHTREHLQELGEALDCDSDEGIPLTLADQMLTQLSLRFNAFLASWVGGPLDSQAATLLKIGQFILKLQQGAYRAQRQAVQIAEARREAEREVEREIRAEAYQDYLKERAAARKAEEAQRKEKPRKPAVKNEPVQPVTEAAPTPAQSSPIKLNQGSPANEAPATGTSRTVSGAKTD